jgi:hypothetical protein
MHVDFGSLLFYLDHLQRAGEWLEAILGLGFESWKKLYLRPNCRALIVVEDT